MLQILFSPDIASLDDSAALASTSLLISTLPWGNGPDKRNVEIGLN